MKKPSIILISTLVALVACTKIKEVHPELGDGNDEIVTVGMKDVHVEYMRNDIAELQKVVFHYSLIEAQQFTAAEMTKREDFFELTLNDLVSDTLYHYYYEVFPNSGNASITEQKTFHTQAMDVPEPPTPTPPVVELPTVLTAEVSEITANSAVCGGEVTNDGGAEVTERGICLGINENPTLDDNHIAVGNGIGSFSETINGLEANMTYHVRAYANNEKGTAYGLDREFVTASIVVLPTVTTAEITEITTNSAICGGEVTNDGGAEVTERGICWSVNANPTLNESHIASGTGTGAFIAMMNCLNDNTTYHVRAYATNEKGTAYGPDMEFVTASIVVLPTVTTAEITEITANSAVCGGEVTNDGGAEVTERGVCWSMNVNPTLNDSHIVTGTGTGAFTAEISDLEANTTYHVRAYATNEMGTAYGLSVVFTTVLVVIGDCDYVDLGLPSGTLWATCNVGANAPEEYGDYFAWGEIEPKAIYDWSTYKYGYSDHELFKYCCYFGFGLNGYVDNLIILLPEDDAATAYYGDGVRIPTHEEWEELGNYCNSIWTSQNDVNGRLFVGPNGNSVFLPSAGVWSGDEFIHAGTYGHYWSSSLDNEYCPAGAWRFDFNMENYDMVSSYRYFGRSIRPVRSASK